MGGRAGDMCLVPHYHRALLKMQQTGNGPHREQFLGGCRRVRSLSDFYVLNFVLNVLNVVILVLYFLAGKEPFFFFLIVANFVVPVSHFLLRGDTVVNS
jgi:hypothetical protein